MLYLLGTALASLGRQDEAIGAFEVLLQAEPKHQVAAECTYRLGLAHKALHHWEAASARFAEASAVAGFRDAPGATFQQAVCLHLAGKADDAVTTMKGLPAVPGQPAAVRRDGHRRAVAGGGGAGRRGAGAVEGPDPAPAIAADACRFGKPLVDDFPAEAEEVAGRALDHWPGSAWDAPLYEIRGKARFRQGHYVRAAADLKAADAATTPDPRSADLAWLRAAALARSKQSAAAVAAMDEALAGAGLAPQGRDADGPRRGRAGVARGPA